MQNYLQKDFYGSSAPATGSCDFVGNFSGIISGAIAFASTEFLVREVCLDDSDETCLIFSVNTCR